MDPLQPLLHTCRGPPTACNSDLLQKVQLLQEQYQTLATSPYATRSEIPAMRFEVREATREDRAETNALRAELACARREASTAATQAANEALKTGKALHTIQMML